jgi:hypothetical protein
MTVMAQDPVDHPSIRPIPEKEFALFQTLIRQEAGIRLSETKKALLVGRLSRRLRELGLSSFSAYYRFGNVALELLLQKVLNLGSRKRDLDAKLFGGACVIEAFEGNKHHLGLKNVQMARRFLWTRGFPSSARTSGSNTAVSSSSTSRTERPGSSD